MSISTVRILVLTVPGSLFAAAVLLNVIKQILFKKKDEPPVVFHWLPFIGNAITYGQDPTKFLKECQAKVGLTITFPVLLFW